MDSEVDSSSEDPLDAGQRSSVPPDVVRSYRYQLTPGEDVIDTATWAGSVPQVNGVAPRVRVGRNSWFNLLWLLPIGFLLLIVAVAVAKACAVMRSCIASSGAIRGLSWRRRRRERSGFRRGWTCSTSSTCSS